ncbi:MAG: helix-turn-helix transcriptional regulator [Clostridia bacterium]|nr:helix-turn-helix transcriptional regulator [Clostridia bacterium]
MFENMAVRIIGGYSGERNHFYADNKKRPFHAVALRLEGESVFEYKGRKRRVGKGDIVYIPACIDYKIACEHEQIIVIHFEAFGSFGDDIIFFTPHNVNYYTDAFRRIIKNIKTHYAHDLLQAVSELYMIFSLMEKELTQTKNILSENVKEAFDYIHRNFTDPELSIGRITAIASVSDTYFRRIFNQVYKTTPVKYINKIRIDYACSLLISGTYTVEETAEKSGFNDTKYFSRIFRQYKGCPPSAFKVKRLTH